MAKKYILAAEVSREAHAKIKRAAKSKNPRMFVKDLVREALEAYARRLA